MFARALQRDYSTDGSSEEKKKKKKFLIVQGQSVVYDWNSFAKCSICSSSMRLNRMNRSYIDYIHRFYDSETCRQQSPCYLLLPPPRPPRLPKLILPYSSLAIATLPSRISFVVLFLTLFITLFSTCALLFYLNVKFQFFDKFQQRYRRRKDFNSIDQPSTIYNSIATEKSYQSFLQPSFFDHHYVSSTHAIHFYDDYYPSYPLTPVCHTYELSPSKLVCSNCLYETLRRKQQCLCENFFVPIK